MDTLFKPKESFKLETCNIYNLYNDIQFKMSKLFIDTRTSKEYLTRHVRSAVNIPLNSVDLFRLDSGAFSSKIESFIARKIYSITKIIWYGDIEFNPNDSKQKLFYQRSTDIIINKIKEKNKTKFNFNALNDTNKAFKAPKVYILNCKYCVFEGKYGFLCDNKASSTDPNTDANDAKSELLIDFLSIYMNRKMKIKDHLKVYPSQIIDDRYFLGNASQCCDVTILKNLGITHIINCTQTLSNEFEKVSVESSISLQSSSISYSPSPQNDNDNDDDCYYAEYIRVPVQDVPDQDIKKYFIQAIKFIQHTLCGINNKILCHCHAGISRSSTVTISYLMYSDNLSLVEALKYTKARRTIVNPNEGFRNQLIEFEKYLNIKRRVLNKEKLRVYDLDEFVMDNICFDNKSQDDMEYIAKELKNCVEQYFFDLMYDDIFYFMDKNGSMIMNKYPQLFGILIEDIFLNQSNCNRQLFILLMMALFKYKKISNINNHFVDDVLCCELSKRVHDNVIDSPYYLQFIAALFAHLLSNQYLFPPFLSSFCEASIKYQKLKILNEKQLKTVILNGDKTKNMEHQFDLLKYQCSKIILYTLKELELLDSFEIMSKFKIVKLRNLICIVLNAFQESDQRYLAYIYH